MENSNNLLARAKQITVEISHRNNVVDDSEPLVGEPVEVNRRDELVVRGSGFAFFIKTYDHDDETVLVTKARSIKTRPRDRATTFSVESIEVEFQ